MAPNGPLGLFNLNGANGKWDSISIVVKSGRSRAKSSLVHAIFERFFERNSLSKNGRTNGIAVLTTPTAHAHSGGGGGGWNVDGLPGLILFDFVSEE